MNPRSRELAKNLALAAFLAGGLLLVRAGALPFTAWLAMTAVVILFRLVPRLDPYRDELLVTDDALTRQHGSRLRRTLVETVRWDALRKVTVLTHETGPGRGDMLFLLYGTGAEGVAVPGELARKHGLVELLARRLQGFRLELVAQACASAGRESFVLWESGPAAQEAPA